MALLMLVGLGLASALGDTLGVVPMMDAAAGLYLLAGLVALVMMRNRNSRRGESDSASFPSD